jgi:hypothetical protein
MTLTFKDYENRWYNQVRLEVLGSEESSYLILDLGLFAFGAVERIAQ